MSTAAELEALTQDYGREIFGRLSRNGPLLFTPRWWDDRVMGWSMRDEAVKVQLFRFVDVLPMLRSPATIVGHLREYFAEGVPVYVLDRTVPLVERLIHAPRTQFPDHLAQKPTSPVLQPVSGKTAIGSGGVPTRRRLSPNRSTRAASITSEASIPTLLVYHRSYTIIEPNGMSKSTTVTRFAACRSAV